MSGKSLPTNPCICQAPDCGKTFYRYLSALTRAKYCSNLCKNRTIAKRPLGERFWEKVAIGALDACWLWQGSHSSQGYGRIRFEKKTHQASCVAWFLTAGVWPTLDICHTCDTPACVNPAHLWEGTTGENCTDMVTKGRHYSVTQPDRVARGERASGAKLRNADYARIRELYATGLYSYAALAQHYPISASGIRYIVKQQKP